MKNYLVSNYSTIVFKVKQIMSFLLKIFITLPHKSFFIRIGKLLRKFEKLPIFYPLAMFLVSTILFGRFLLSEGTYGMYSDWPIPPLNLQIKQQVVQDVFFVWSPNYLGYERVRQAGNYIDLLSLAISYIFGVGGEIISKYPIALLFLIPQISYFVLRKFNIERFYSFVGSLYYSLCVPFLFDSLISGYLKFIVSYSAFPLFLWYLYKLVISEKFSTKNFILFTLSYIAVATSLNFFFIVLLPIVVFFFLGLLKRKLNIKFGALLAGQLALSMFLTVLTQATAFFIPVYDLVFKSSGEGIRSLQSGLITFLTFSHPVILNAFRQFSASINFYERNYPIYGREYLLSNLYFSVSLSLVFISVIFNSKKRDLHVIGFYICAVLSVFILKGINSPFGDINAVFYKLPLMAVLRNISYITFITGFSYAFLLAYSSQNVQKLIRLKYVQHLFPIAMLLLLYVGIYPLRHPEFFETLKTFKVHDEEEFLYRSLQSEKGSFYVYNIPHLSPFYYEDAVGNLIGPGFNTFVSNPAKPSLYSGMLLVGSSHHFDAFLNNSIYYKTDDSILPLLLLANIKYVVINPHFESVFPQFINTDSNKWFKSVDLLQSIRRNKHFSELLRDRSLSLGDIVTYKVPSYENTDLALAPNIFLNVGNYRSYVDHFYLLNKQYDGVFVNDYKSYVRDLIKFIQFTQTGKLDVVGAFVDPQYKYQPGTYLDKNRNKATQEWAQLFRGEYWWYDYVVSADTESLLVSSKEPSRFSFPVEMERGKKYALLAKMLFSKSGSEIDFRLNSSVVGKIVTKENSYRGAKYVFISEITSDRDESTLSFTSTGGTNSVYEVIVVPTKELSSALESVDKIISELPVILSYTADSENGVGAENSMFDFYYSRPVSSAPTSQELTVDIPKADNYDLLVRLKKRKITLRENLEMEYFKIIYPGTSIVQKIIKPNNYKKLEFCISTTYISSATNKPSNGIPEKKLNVSIWSENTNQNIFSENLDATESYSPGDWFYNCFSLDEGAVKGTGNENLVLHLTSDSKDVMWGVPYRSDPKSELGYSIKYQLSGVLDDRPSTLKVSAENFNMSKRVDFKDDAMVVLTEKQYFREGPQTFYFDCGIDCVVDRVYMFKGASLHDVAAEGNGKVIPKLEKYKNGRIEFLLEKNFTGKGVLLFKQSYNPSWELLQNENTKEEHLVLNGYQNGWVMSDINDKVQGKIIFRKQSIYNLANIVSLTILIVLTTSAILLSLYKTKFKHETNK